MPHTPLTWADLAARPRPVADATIAYGDDAMQKVDVWLPAGKGPHPVVLMVHGGCWQTSIADRAEFDNYYIENWSLNLDFKILVLTVLAVLRSAED